MVLLTNIWAKEMGMVAGAFTITHCLVSGATVTFSKIRISKSAVRHGRNYLVYSIVMHSLPISCLTFSDPHPKSDPLSSIDCIVYASYMSRC